MTRDPKADRRTYADVQNAVLMRKYMEAKARESRRTPESGK